MNLTGYRTFIVMFVGGTLTPLLAKHGLNLDADQQAWAVGIIMMVLGAIMRLVTKTPPGQAQTPVLPPPVKS